MTAATMLRTLDDWATRGWLRRLDSAFAGFIGELDAAARPELLLATAALAHVESQGHVCLMLDRFVAEPGGTLGWGPEPAEALRREVDALGSGFDEWLALLVASPLVATDDEDGDESRPLMLRGRRLYLRRYWRFERQVADQLLARVGAPAAVDAAAVREVLDLLFPPRADGAFDWQKFACAVALRGPLSVITGGPGTGKTYTAARLLALLFAVDRDPRRLRIALAAPTGKAAARLKQAIDTALAPLGELLAGRIDLPELASHIPAATTLHALLGARPDTRRFRADAAHPLELDVLIVDEASMIHLEMMAALLQALPPQARLILLGDKDQLASVEAGAVLGDLCRDAEAGRYDAATAAYALAAAGQQMPPEFRSDEGSPLARHTAMLRESRRFHGPIGQLALAVNRGETTAAAALLRNDASGALHVAAPPSINRVVRLALAGRDGAPGGYAHYLRELHARPAGTPSREDFDAWVVRVLQAFERFRILCAVREGEWGTEGLNTAIERALVADGGLERAGHAAWYEGRPVMVTRNDAGVGVFNGDIGIALRPLDPDGPLRAYFLDGTVPRSVGVSRLASVETAFAMTVHKSQGSEFEHTVLVLPAESSRVLTRELVYTGITRARQAFTLASGAPGNFALALSQRTRRASGLLELLR